VWVTDAPEPVLVRVANIQHLATPIRAHLARPVAAVELAGLLHPTPAVGGEPIATATPLIPALEGLDRGWYAGPVGGRTPNEDGEFCVALRCALLRGPVAHLLRGRRRRRRLGPRRRARRDRDQARRAAARPRGLGPGDRLGHSGGRSACWARRSGADLDDRRAGPRRERLGQRPRGKPFVSGARTCRQPYSAGGLGEVEAVRRGDVLLEDVGLVR
jgi:hypothetical protein